jgi:molybdopterin-guanine dinucleotide biosynthesis protein A
MPKTAALLVGGRASRLGGRDKSQILIGGRTILDRQVDALRGVADRIVLVASRPRPSPAPGIDVVLDARPGCGSLGALYTALREAGGDVLVVACDLPFVTAAFLAHVQDALGNADAAVPRTADGLHPLCAAYSGACLESVARSLEAGRLKIVETLAGLRVREIGPDEVAPFDLDGSLLLNLNTPDDEARAKALAAVSGA